VGVTIQGGNNIFSTNVRILSSIVEDGLILFFDPNDDRSYPDSGTTVNNIAPEVSSNGVNGTLDNADMYVEPADSAAYFRVQSTATVKRLDFDSTISRDTDDDDSTVLFYFWSNYDGTGQYGNSQAFFGGKYTNYFALTGGTNGTYGSEAETNGGTVGNHDYMAGESGVFITGSWQSWTNVVQNATSSNYYNGVRHATEYHMNVNSVHSFSRLGSNSTGTTNNDRGGDIRMGALLIYNRALSENEIKQNLDILNRRFS